MTFYDDIISLGDGYTLEPEDTSPKPTKEQVKKFCEDNLCPHCFYNKDKKCSNFAFNYFFTSKFMSHELAKISCFTANIKPEN